MRVVRPLALLLSALTGLADPPEMFRGNAAHTGVYASTAPSLSAMAWAFQTKGRILSSPVVHRGTVYIGSTDHRLYALNAADGVPKWSFATQGPVNGSPAVADDLVIVGSMDGTIYALEAESGKPRWTFRTEGERRYSAPGIHGAIPRTEVMPDPFDVFLSSPVIAGDRVYIGSGDHHVYALDLASGALKWKFKTGNVVHATPAVADGVVYIGSWDRNLYALRAESGEKLWSFATGDDTQIYNQVGIASSAAVANGLVYFGCRDGHFYAVDAKTGLLKWSHDNHKGWVIASPAVDSGVVYFPTSDGRRFKALDAFSGAIRFDQENRAISFSSPALAGGAAYFGTSDGWIHAVDTKTGRETAAYQTEGNKQNGPKYLQPDGQFNNAALYPAATLEGLFIGVDRMFSVGAVLSSPVIAEGVLYVGSADGRLYALK
jgi:outer membrane protein assembly factor BamB